MNTGKLYSLSDNKFVANINYQFHNKSAAKWWGELTLTEYIRTSDDEEYIIELEDKRKGKCRLKKRVNRAASGVPPRYVYYFTGIGKLE